MPTMMLRSRGAGSRAIPKIGTVHQTRTFAAASAASAPPVSNGRFAASVSVHGQLLARAQITLRERADHLVGLVDRPIVARRYFPRLCAGMHDKPALDELVRCVIGDVLITEIWIGEGALVFPGVHGEEFKWLGPIGLARGF